MRWFCDIGVADSAERSDGRMVRVLIWMFVMGVKVAGVFGAGILEKI